MMRGYPVGIILLWETYQPIQFRYFDSHFTADKLHTFHDNTHDKRMKLVLDGQQRLSSIYVALKGQHEGRGLYLDVLSGREKDDYAEEKYDFQFYKAVDAAEVNASEDGPSLADYIGPEGTEVNSRRYYVHVPEIIGRDVLKLREQIAKKLKLSEEDKLRMERNLITLSHALKGDEEILKTQTIDHKLPSDDQNRKTAFDILEIFVRINTQGVSLSRSDLIVSMLRLYWKEASEVLPAFIKEINDGTGLAIDNGFVIRCMFSTAGIGTRLDFDLLRKQSNVVKVKASYKTCFDAIPGRCGLRAQRLPYRLWTPYGRHQHVGAVRPVPVLCAEASVSERQQGGGDQVALPLRIFKNLFTAFGKQNGGLHQRGTPIHCGH